MAPSPPPPPNKRRKFTAPDIHHRDDQSEDGYEPWRPGTPMKKDESGSPVCGICLSEGGKSITGQIDSCDHYFCFVCILEWAKVESRCPMCKQRFTSIRRPPKLGVFAGERIVRVPQRDQVYHLSGNATTTRSDPYADTSCMVCRKMSDESLLLLCDLCDSAAHTYCVGFSHTVPEGDWFCHDCTVSRAHHEKADQGDQSVDSENEKFAEECVEPAATDPNISIFDIVKDADDSSLPKQISRFASPGHGSSIADEETGAFPKRHKNLGSCWAGSCKGQEEGSVSFLSSPNEQSRARDGHVGFTEREKKDPYDTEKAWKMLEMAKIAQKIRSENGDRLSKAPSFSSSSKILSKIRSRSYLSSEKQQTGVRNLGSSVMKMKQKQILQRLETGRDLPKQKQILDPTHQAGQHKSELPSSAIEFREYPLHRKAPVRTDYFMSRSCADNAHKNTSNKDHSENRSSFRLNTAGFDSIPPQTKTGFAVAPSSNPNPGKCSATKTEKQNENAKTEIQSLVKLNMKLLTKDKPLGVRTFKEVARISTHTILAVCGLEHSKQRTRPFDRPICSHQSSTLLQDVCPECFSAFATDVVRSVMRENMLLK
ncbi:PREDICTED: uncharacterized protein LOC104819392 isoform X2 [Tarenaya hassleriana]|uniref:uncharacterized protein LOC104819392 isoform X2 n=1 Tax=Tarenaya hassleriana TaxID=28532 RepID=UPI00053C75B4|nr:PREDICTED: uncharacterized protein LOC104819392 isoform X2 [Tarenaya hassleriana]